MVSNRDETQAGTGKEQLVDPEERKTTPGGHGGSPNGTSGQGALEPIYPTHEVTYFLYSTSFFKHQCTHACLLHYRAQEQIFFVGGLDLSMTLMPEVWVRITALTIPSKDKLAEDIAWMLLKDLL